MILDKERQELQRKREQMILEKEEMLHNKEIELDRKEKWLRHQAEMQQQIKTANQYEEELNKREISAEEKLFILRRREQQLDRVEQTLMIGKQKQPESTLVEIPSHTEKKECIAEGLSFETVVDNDSSTRRKETKDIGIETDVPEKSQFFPKFSTFSGDEPKQKNESSFSEWTFVLPEKEDIPIR